MPEAIPTATFRIPRTALIGVYALAICVTPVAFAVPGLQVLYVLPVGLAVWLLRTRTVVSTEAIVAHRVLRARRLPWSDIAGLHVQERAGVRAVLGTGEEVRLPAVRARDLPVLARVSGGRIDDPTAVPE